MRAWVLKKQAAIEERPLELMEVPAADPRHDEIRIKILVNRLDLKIRTSRFLFKELQDALISAEHGRLEHPNAVVEIADTGEQYTRGH